MSKTLPISIVFYLICLSSFSQGMTYLNANNTKAGFYPSPSIFIDTKDDMIDKASFEFPKDSGTQTIFVNSYLLSGYTLDDSLVGASSLYYNYDWSVGPKSNIYDTAYDTIYKKVFKLDAQEVSNHVANAQYPNYIPPKSIAEWPVYGDTSKGQRSLLFDFEDRNANLIYEPNKGEYPSFCGDQYVSFLLNDDREDSRYRICKKMNIEAKLSSYVFYPKGNPIDNTIFLRFSFKNTSNKVYKNVIFSSFFDGDLGCYYNDRVGCDTTQNTFYFYNNLGNDPDGCNTGSKGFGSKKVAQGIVFLNQNLYSFVSRQYGINQNVTGNCDVFRSFQEGKFGDGSGITPYGSGQNGGNGNTRFLFPGNPTDSSKWSSVFPQNGTSISGEDYSVFGSIIFDTLYPNETKTIDMAVVHTIRDTVSKPYDEVNLLLSDVAFVKNYYQQNLKNCKNVYTSLNEESFKKEIIYPNPTKGIVYINISKQQVIEVMDVSGKFCASFNVNKGDSQIDISKLDNGVYFTRIENAIYKIVKY